MANCRCGKPAIGTIDVPINVFAGIQQLSEPHEVCEYHAAKARVLRERFKGGEKHDQARAIRIGV